MPFHVRLSDTEQNVQKSVSHCFSLFAATCNDGQCDAPRYQRVRAKTAYTKGDGPACKFIETEEDCKSALKELNLDFAYVMLKKTDPKWWARGCAWDRWGAYFNNNTKATKCHWNSHGPKTDCICKV